MAFGNIKLQNYSLPVGLVVDDIGFSLSVICITRKMSFVLYNCFFNPNLDFDDNIED